METESLQNISGKYTGCMLGLAVGDALGAHVEGMTRSQIYAFHGEVRDYLDGAYGVGGWTDDTAMALAIAESYIENRGYNQLDIARRFVKWFEEDGRGIGFTTAKVLYLISGSMQPQEASKLVWEESGQNLAGNGALMRCAPVTLARLNNNDALMRESCDIGMITHFDPRSVESCLIFNALLADIINESPKELHNYLHLISNEDVKCVISEIHETKMEDLRLGGYVIDTFTLALWTYLNFDNFEQALISVINLGGDTDTNGAVVGALMGGKYGIESIPVRWLNGLNQRERIENAANALVKLFGSS